MSFSRNLTRKHIVNRVILNELENTPTGAMSVADLDIK